MNKADREQIQHHAEAIAERARVTAHALGLAAGCLDRLFDQAVEAQSHPGLTLLLYASTALQRGRDALKADMRAAVEIFALAAKPARIDPTDPALLDAMRQTAEQLHALLERGEDPAKPQEDGDVWKLGGKT